MKASKNSKSVFLITIDALRPDHLKAYGYQRDTTPNLTEFAKRGVLFSNAFTNGPETPSSFCSIFTSSLPLVEGGFSPLPRQKVYFPQLLKENDIFCYAIHSNPNLSRIFNYDRGFDVFLDGERFKSLNRSETNLKSFLISSIRKLVEYKGLIRRVMFKLIGFNKIKNFLRQKFPKITDILLPFTPMAYNAPYLVNKIISFLKSHDGPLFLWTHFMDVHSPYDPPLENLINVRGSKLSPSRHSHLINDVYDTPHNFDITEDIIHDLEDLYDGEINFMDEYLGVLLDFISKRYKKDCLILILADHGESFFEHGYFNHQGHVYEQLLKVPLILNINGYAPKQSKVSEIVQLMDIAPTILDFFNIPSPEEYSGQSLLPLIRGKQINKEDMIITETYQKRGKMKRNNQEGYKLISLRTETWKFIYDEEQGTESLFNIKSDPEEIINLIEQKPELTQEFRSKLANHLERIELVNEKSKLSSVIQKLDLSKL